MQQRILLVGNPNCGKTTLFNRLTGQNQHVGNWAGVTVERREAPLKWSPALSLTDLPGIYSLAAYTPEETVTRDVLYAGGQPVLNILDGRSLERGLYLTLQLVELGCPLVVAVGMLDETRARGIVPDHARLARYLGVPVLSISARTGEGFDDLRLQIADIHKWHAGSLLYGAVFEHAIADCTHAFRQDGAFNASLPARFLSIQALQGDLPTALKPAALEKLIGIREELETNAQTDSVTFCAAQRYGKIDSILSGTNRFHSKPDVPTGKSSPARQEKGELLDKIILNRFLAYPLFAFVLWALFSLCFGAPGQFSRQALESALSNFRTCLDALFRLWAVAPPLSGLLLDGVLSGLGGVLTFLPQVCLLFLGLTMLEECGYLSRAAFLMDRPLKLLGLTGKSFIPLLMGFGCTTPAVMASRTLENSRDRHMTVLLTPFFSCGAKFSVYALFAGIFFPRHEALAVAVLYGVGILGAALYGLLLREGTFRGGRSPLLMELAPYRLPNLRNVVRNTLEKSMDFLRKAGTVIFLITILIWFMQHFDLSLRYLPASGPQSIFQRLGNLLAPVFAPLGFGFAQAAVALIAGAAAKEAIVASLYVACAPLALPAALTQLFSPLAAASFLVFCVLYAPCVSALAAMGRELGSIRRALLAAAAQTLFAYFCAMAVYQIGLLLQRL